MSRLEEILPGKIENDERILREVALFAEKIDITEEVTRFHCHLKHFEELFNQMNSPSARLLNFLCKNSTEKSIPLGVNLPIWTLREQSLKLRASWNVFVSKSKISNSWRLNTHGLFARRMEAKDEFLLSAPRQGRENDFVEKLLKEFPSIVVKHFVYDASAKGRRNSRGALSLYHRKEFERKIDAGIFYEYVKLYGHLLWDLPEWVKEQQRKGKHVILVIDTQGALKLKTSIACDLDFYSASFIGILRTRLIKRQTETPGMIEQRVEWAQRELDMRQAI